jgi:hypothetical protein
MFGERSPFGAQTVPAGGFGYDKKSVHNLEREYNKLLEQFRLLEANRDEIYYKARAMGDLIRENFVQNEDDRRRINEYITTRACVYKAQETKGRG